MLKGFSSGYLIFLLIITISIIEYFPVSFGSHYNSVTLEGHSGIEKKKPNDSLPYYRYKFLADSLLKIEETENRFRYRGSGLQVFGIGTSTYDHTTTADLHYLCVEGYLLEEHTAFYSNRKENFFLYPVWDRIQADEKYGHLEKFVTETGYGENADNSSGTVYIPVSKTTVIVCKIFLGILGAGFAILGFYALIMVPARLLFQISKGKFFSDENIGSLYLIALYLIIFALLPGILTIIFHLLYRNHIPDFLNFSYYDALMNNTPALLAGLVVLLFAQAFRKGYDLQMEQELTV